MAKSRNVQRISNKKRGRPKVRFSIWAMIVIFALSFAGCFILYMAAANFNEDFLTEEFDNIVVETTTVPADEPETTTVSAVDTPQTEAAGEAVQNVVANPVPQSAAVDASYFDNCCLVTDSTLLDISKYTDIKDIIGNDQLSAAGCTTVKVASNYGTVTVYETLQIKKPMNVYIMLGSDIGTSSMDDMINSYTTLVNNLKGYKADTNIYIMQLPPVPYDTETVTNAAINEFNDRLLNLANTAGVHCIDTSTALKSPEGTLSEEYWDAEAQKLNEAAYKAIAGYILTHTV